MIHLDRPGEYSQQQHTANFQSCQSSDNFMDVNTDGLKQDANLWLLSWYVWTVGYFPVWLLLLPCLPLRCHSFTWTAHLKHHDNRQRVFMTSISVFSLLVCQLTNVGNRFTLLALQLSLGCTYLDLHVLHFHHTTTPQYNRTLLLDTGHSPHLIYATLQSPGRKSSPHSPACSPATIAHREPWNSDPLIFFARNSSLGPSLVFHLQKKATQKTQSSYLPWTSPCIH